MRHAESHTNMYFLGPTYSWLTMLYYTVESAMLEPQSGAGNVEATMLRPCYGLNQL